jgi:hypothetical protein
MSANTVNGVPVDEYLQQSGRPAYEFWPQELQEALDDALWDGVDFEDYECADNFRYARKSNAEEMAVFEQKDREGCCGSYVREIEVGDETIIFGFNYGH